MTALTLGAAALLSVASRAVAATSEGENPYFHRCVCQNDGSNRCYVRDDWDASTHDCQTFFWAQYGGTVAAVLLSLALLVFPFIFLWSRACCNCCGGRYATSGCCCTEPSTRSTFPGYRNCSIITTKLWLLITTGFAIGLFAALIPANSTLHTVALDSIDVTETALRTVTAGAPAVASVAQAMRIVPMYNLASDSEIIALQSFTDVYGGSLTSVWSFFSNLRDGEKDVRMPLVTQSPVGGLIALGVALLFAAINFRKVVWLCFLVLTLSTALTVFAATGMGAIATTIGLACDNYQETVEPAIASVLQQNYGVCGQPEASDAMATIDATLRWTVLDGNSAFCRNVVRQCDQLPNGCSITTCSNTSAFAKPPRSIGVTNVSMPMIASTLETLGQELLLLPNVAHQDAMAKIAGALVQFNAAKPFFDSCEQVSLYLDTRVKPQICSAPSSLVPRPLYHHIGRVCIWLSCLLAPMLLSIIAVVKGMKRFRPLNSYTAGGAAAMVDEDEHNPVMAVPVPPHFEYPVKEALCEVETPLININAQRNAAGFDGPEHDTRTPYGAVETAPTVNDHPHKTVST